MPTLTFGVAGTDGGTYGTLPIAELGTDETFGSWGVAVCVILLLQKTNGDLFCGHMSCAIPGLGEFEGDIKTRTQALLDEALGDENKGQKWFAVTNGGQERTSTWMRDGMEAWFTPGTPSKKFTNKEDAYFKKKADGGLQVFTGGNLDGATTMVASFPFNIPDIRPSAK